jgi:bacteriorhodopsin
MEDHQVPKEEIELFGMTRYILLPALMLAVAYSFFEHFIRSPSRPRAIIMSRVVVVEFCIKITYYSYMANYNGGIVHVNNRALGPERPIYLARWIGWSVAIPIVIFMNTIPMMEDMTLTDALKRIFPMQICSSAYCWTCYLGCIITNPIMGWILLSMGCGFYCQIIVDQSVFLAERLTRTKQAALKGYLIMIKEMIFMIYTFVFLLGEWDYISSFAIQRFYCFSDVSLKACTASFMFIFWASSSDKDFAENKKLE